MIFKLTPNDSINKTLKQCKKNDIILLSKGIYHEKIYSESAQEHAENQRNES